MKFDNGKKSLTLSVVNYEFPERTGKGEEYDYDANWLVLRAEYREGRSLRSFENSCVLTYELQDLAAGLKLLAGGVQECYESSFTEPYFEVAAELMGISHYMVYASFAMLVAEDQWENFSVECVLDDTALKALAEEIDAECRAFPEKK